ncbi:MAG: hypothetical protein IPJ34_29510 [Myxococcales bacterium]|nr:hypothetical protein [Myxococcales bacterium]
MHNKIWMLLVAVFALAPVVGCDKKEEKKEDKDKKDDDDDKGKKKKKKSSDDDDDDKDKKKKKKDDDDDKKDEKKDKAEEGDKKKIGIKSCDEYLDKMDKCSEKTKLGADTAKTLKTSADSTRKAWLTAADGPGKSTLETSCKTMLESSAKSYKTVCPGVFDE